MNKEEYLYRIEEIYYSRGLDQFDNVIHVTNIVLYLYKYIIIKNTKKGVWIKPYNGKLCDINCGFKKFVLLNARKKFACKTKEEALESFKARKNKQIKILEAQLDNATIALSLANNMRIQNYE